MPSVVFTAVRKRDIRIRMKGVWCRIVICARLVVVAGCDPAVNTLDPQLMKNAVSILLTCFTFSSGGIPSGRAFGFPGTQSNMLRQRLDRPFDRTLPASYAL